MTHRSRMNGAGGAFRAAARGGVEELDATGRPVRAVRPVPEPLRLLVDARLLVRGGIGRYVREVTSRWLRDDAVERITFLGVPDELEPWLERLRGARKAAVLPWTEPPYSPARHARWARELWRAEAYADIVFFPHYDVPLVRKPARYVVTVHDLTQFRRGHGFPAWKRWGGRRILEGALRGAEAVVTVSRYTHDDLLHGRPWLEGRVTVVPNGVSEVFRTWRRRAGDRHTGAFHGHRPYLLTVGEARPHKNLGLAVEVLARLAPRHPDLSLLLAGEDGHRAGPLRERARAHGIEDRVLPLGALRERWLAQAYAGAEAVLVPSLHEGFGLPVLEAMSCGAPVLAAKTSSLPEVTGGLCPLLDPRDPERWADAVERILVDSGGREERAWLGRRRAAAFDWERTARRTLEVVRRAAIPWEEPA